MLGRGGAVALLSSGSRRPPERRGRPWPARARRLWRHRATRVGAVVLAGAAALTLLQLTAPPQRRPAPASAPTPTRTPAPSFDRLPGRTPIPTPAQTGDRLSGPLPVTGDPGRASATRAANLVLGRYCAEPARYGLTVEPYTDGRSIDFHRLTVVVVDRVLTDSGTEMLLSLVWEGHAYRWFGPLSLVNGC
jgi:hypothetical protein